MNSVDDLLRATSRTFALAVSFLPEPTATEVGVSYLLLRAIGAIEGATHRTSGDRLSALDGFVKLLDQAPAALRDHGLGTALSQLQLSSVADDIARRISGSGPLFAPL